MRISETTGDGSLFLWKKRNGVSGKENKHSKACIVQHKEGLDVQNATLKVIIFG